MGNTNKLIQLSGKPIPSASQKATPQLSIIVDKALSIYLNKLEDCLQELLVKADDHLFDKSTKSEDGRHFTALRRLRLSEQRLLTDFNSQIVELFKESVGKRPDASFFWDNAPTLRQVGGLSLLDDDQLEENITVDSMAARAAKDNELALQNLRLRLDFLLSDRQLEESKNPFSPKGICNAFAKSIQPVELDIEFRLVLFKYFERSLLSELELIYNEVNQYLIENGVLPDLKPVVIHRKATHQRRESDRQPRDSSGVSDQNLVELLTQLLSDSRGGNSRGEAQVEPAQLAGYITNNLPGFDVANVQPDNDNNDLPQARLISPSQLREAIIQQLPEAIAQKVKAHGFGGFNDDMIDVVTMLFDFILDDDNLNVEIKALLARLQIPILKVGLSDKTFLSNRQHAARVLLNDLARAGIACDPKDPGAKSLVEEIKSIVLIICEQFSTNINLFDELLERFNQFRGEFSKRAVIFERRVKEAEEGKARTETSKARVNRTLKHICLGKHVPQPVQHIFKNAWVQVMLLESLRADEESWEKACIVAKMLVWSVQPVKEQAALDKRLANLPVLIRNLKVGFEKISLTKIESSGLLDNLEDCHRQVIDSSREKIIQSKKEPILRISQNAPEKNDMMSPQAEVAESSQDVQSLIHDSDDVITEVSIESIAFEPCETSPEENEINPAELSEQTLKTIERLSVGAWVELKLQDGFKRCKLAATITSTKKWIFVNASGAKVAEFSQNQLAEQIESKMLRMLDNEALFDRALESVIANLRKMKKQSCA